MNKQAMQKDMGTLLAKVQVDMSKLMRERDELVAALENLIAWQLMVGGSHENSAIQQARAALAKVNK